MHHPLLASLLASVAALCLTPAGAVAEPESALLSASELGDILDADLSVQQWELTSPNGPSETTPPACRAMSNATTTLVYGASWNSYEGASYADGEGSDYRTVVGQIVGVFPTQKAASEVFAALAKGLRSCGSKTSVEHRSSGNLTWRNAVDEITEGGASWHSILNNKPSWRCSLNARLSDKVMVEASVCRFVDPASPAKAAKLADQVGAIARALAERAS
ncbi:sensor domain-containing protein [Segniliparus rugosus]|uniref:PknH-like extracellular domain-containing protein n=1 Tax=Segniliparus rugosus (strain ATCC BAA-974 / DSM 45345 / CCUG 50838 / CIP 108380 / JCM 13579 / CDC 945) TaxID=679197 RepID=E5XPY5_SEGRC|nr:sensor domain-containing protein [Segniliparus rugosus]EFV13580.1 hypothetical protein HMPREF9336_01557 [Segniliparus rugosus ATCC BAA-974]